MIEIFKKDIPVSICAPGNVIFVSDVLEKIEGDLDYITAETVATFSTPDEAFAAFAELRNTITFQPQKMRFYKEIIVTMYFLCKSSAFSAGCGDDEEFVGIDDYYPAQFSKNFYSE